MIGIIPAAGKAERMDGVPKMLFPTPNGILLKSLIRRMSAVTHDIHIGTRPELDDLLFHLVGTGWVHAMKTATMSETVLNLRRGSDWVIFGMPDSYFEDNAAFSKLVNELQDGADVAVGVFQTRPEQRYKLGMVEVAPDGEVLHVVDKPSETHLVWAWGVLAWKPKFWNMLCATDPHIGYALPRALAAEMDVRAVKMDGQYWDCGTPDEYFALIRHLTSEKVTA